jgi:hypothetical protein
LANVLNYIKVRWNDETKKKRSKIIVVIGNGIMNVEEDNKKELM